MGFVSIVKQGSKCHPWWMVFESLSCIFFVVGWPPALVSKIRSGMMAGVVDTAFRAVFSMAALRCACSAPHMLCVVCSAPPLKNVASIPCPWPKSWSIVRISVPDLEFCLPGQSHSIPFGFCSLNWIMLFALLCVLSALLWVIQVPCARI